MIKKNLMFNQKIWEFLIKKIDLNLWIYVL